MQGTLAVVSQSGQNLSFFDLASGERTAHLRDLTAEPHELCFDTRRNLLYISHTYRHGHFWKHGDYAHEISIVDCDTRTCISSINTQPSLGPHGLVLDSTNDILYAVVEELEPGKSGGIIGIDLGTREVVKRVESHSKPHWFVMTPDGRKAYTSNKTQNFISVVDLDKETYVGKIDIPSCEEPGMSLDGKFAYFPIPGMTAGPTPADASVQVIDTASDKIVDSFPTGLGPQSVLVTPLNQLMVAKYSFDPSSSVGEFKPLAGRLALYEADTYTLIGEVKTESVPLTIRASADGKWGFVANILKGTVTVVDLTAMTVVRTLDIDQMRDPTKAGHQGAHGMALIA